MDVLTLLKQYGEPVVYLVGIVLLITKVVRPISVIYAINALMLWNMLVRDHDFYVNQKYCNADDKRRYCDLYMKYKALKLNDIADNYKTEVLALPECKPAIRQKRTTKTKGE
jgi:hypothetical protein